MNSIKRSIYRILDTFFKRQNIGNNYLTRWTISKTLRLYIHHFKNGDKDVMHDHPWNFLSIILWGGYYEQNEQHYIKWYPPGSILYRKAEWIHRVILLDDVDPPQEAWTFLWLGWRRRMWGFWCPEGFIPWRKFFREGCEVRPAGTYP